jgi:hypothetical protein
MGSETEGRRGPVLLCYDGSERPGGPSSGPGEHLAAVRGSC